MANTITAYTDEQIMRCLLTHDFSTIGRAFTDDVVTKIKVAAFYQAANLDEVHLPALKDVGGYHKVKGKEITGPKMIGVHGDSYIFAVFKGLGVIVNPKDLGLTDKSLIPIIGSGEMCKGNEGNEVPMRTISYDPLWKTLIDKKMNKKDLTVAAGLAKGTITRMGKNESVTVDVLVKICNALDCDVVDVLEIR